MELTLQDYIQFIEELVLKYGTEINYLAWEEIKKQLNKNEIQSNKSK